MCGWLKDSEQGKRAINEAPRQSGIRLTVSEPAVKASVSSQYKEYTRYKKGSAPAYMVPLVHFTRSS
jgi:hypothetical protein